VSKVIRAPREVLYRAFLDPDALVTWLPPDSMRGVVHAFEGREGGSFRMSLIYPDGDGVRGKTSDNTDTFECRFVRLIPNERIVWATTFEFADPDLGGRMLVSTTLAPVDRGTQVTIPCEHIPPGIRPEDNEAGCGASLEKLASYVEG
jgi:uncharacterized protein YndB with AHSA1/START domain